MFDARSLLDAIVKGAAPQSGNGGLGELMGQILGGPGAPAPATAGRAPSAAPATPPASGGGLDDLLRQMLPGQGAPGSGSGGSIEDMIRNMFPSGAQPATPGSHAAPAEGQPSGGLGDLIGNLQKQLGPGAANLAEVLKNVLGTAVEGAKEGAGKIGEATGAGDAIGKMTGGKTADELIAQIKDMISKNKLGAGATIGGLGGLILGTQAGRSIAINAAKLGALALIGGLAYKAYQNYSQGKPLIPGASDFSAEQAPPGSGFEPEAVSNDDATLYIRAMIAAAAADGRIDAAEQQKVMGSLKQAGLDGAAEEFLANELNNPATVDALARSVATKQQAVQLYTAARIAIEPDGHAEAEFLKALASRLGIEAQLAAHIDGAARSASV